MAQRTNQYFLPRGGISREVIQADICRYLGNDALVRPDNYQGQDGYFITACRNLTSAMVEDLKADSQRWEAKRRDQKARGFPSLGMEKPHWREPGLMPVSYRISTTHQSREYGFVSITGQPPIGYSENYPYPPSPYHQELAAQEPGYVTPEWAGRRGATTSSIVTRRGA